MRLLIDSGAFPPSNGNGFFDYTNYVIDGSINIEDSINVPTLLSFEMAPINNSFVIPSRSCYVKIQSDVYTELVTIPFQDTALAIFDGEGNAGQFGYFSGSGSAIPAKPVFASDAAGILYCLDPVTTTSVQLQICDMSQGTVPPGCAPSPYPVVNTISGVTHIDLFSSLGYSNTPCMGYCLEDNSLIMAMSGLTTLVKWDIRSQSVVTTLNVPNASFDSAAFKNISNDGVLAVRGIDSFILIDTVRMKIIKTISNVHTINSPSGANIPSGLTGYTAFAPTVVSGPLGSAIFCGNASGSIHGSPSNIVILDFSTGLLQDVTGIANAWGQGLRVTADGLYFYAISSTNFTIQKISLQTRASVLSSAAYNNVPLASDGTAYSVYQYSHVEYDSYGHIYASLQTLASPSCPLGLLLMFDNNFNLLHVQGNGTACAAGILNHVGNQCWNGQGIFPPCFGWGGDIEFFVNGVNAYVAHANWVNSSTGNYVNVVQAGIVASYQTPKIIATGFITNQPEASYLGLNQNLPGFGYQQLQYKFKVTSDEWILNSQAPPYIPAFVNQTDSQILASLAQAMMPDFFDTTSFMASGTLIPYYQYDPTQTWSDIAKTFADSNRYWYKVIDKKIYYQPFGSAPLGIAFDETTQSEAQLRPDTLQTNVVSVPPVNDCIVIGDTEPQNNWDNYFIGDGFTSNFQLKHTVFDGTSTQLVSDDWSESSFQTGVWIVSDPQGTIFLESNGNALGALNIIQDGSIQTYLPIENATYIKAQNGLELGGGINLQHGQVTFNGSASGGGGIIGGIFTKSPMLEFDPTHCLCAFKIQGQPNLGTASVTQVTVSGTFLGQVALKLNVSTTSIQPGNVCSCSTFVNATWLNGQKLYVTSIGTASDGSVVLYCTPQNPGILPTSYGPATDTGTLTFSADAVITTASGSAGIYMYPLYNGSLTGAPVVSQPNHQYVLQTWIGAQAANRYTRPYTNLTQTTTYGAQNLAASGTITWVITDYNLGNYVTEQQFPLFGLFPNAVPPVVTKFSITNQHLDPFGVYILLSGLNLNVSLNYTVLSLPPQGYLTVQSLTGASGGNLPWTASQLSVPIVYQMGFGMINQSAQISQAGEAYQLAFYTDDIPSVGARIRFQSWAAGQSIARVQNPGAIANEARVSGDTGIRSAIMTNLSPLPRTSAECEAAAGAAITDREFPQFQGSYAIETEPNSYEALFSPSMYSYPHTGQFFYINNIPSTRGISGQNFVVSAVRMQVQEMRSEHLTISIDYGPDTYLERLLPSFMEREQNLLTPQQTVPPPNPITLDQVLNAKLATLDTAQITVIQNSVTGNYIVVDLSGGTEANAATSNSVLTAIGATGCEVRYVDSGWGVPNAGRVGIFTVDQFVLPRTVRDQTFYLRGINGTLFSRFSKALRTVYPLVPSAPGFVSSNIDSIALALSGDVRDIYGLELRATLPASGAMYFQLPTNPITGQPYGDQIAYFSRQPLPLTPPYNLNGNTSCAYAPVGTSPPSYEVQLGDMLYVTCPSDGSFAQMKLVTGKGVASFAGGGTTNYAPSSGTVIPTGGVGPGFTPLNAAYDGNLSSVSNGFANLFLPTTTSHTYKLEYSTNNGGTWNSFFTTTNIALGSKTVTVTIPSGTNLNNFMVRATQTYTGAPNDAQWSGSGIWNKFPNVTLAANGTLTVFINTNNYNEISGLTIINFNIAEIYIVSQGVQNYDFFSWFDYGQPYPDTKGVLTLGSNYNAGSVQLYGNTNFNQTISGSIVGQVATIKTALPHNYQVGSAIINSCGWYPPAPVNVASQDGAPFTGQYTVQSIIDANTFTILLQGWSRGNVAMVGLLGATALLPVPQSLGLTINGISGVLLQRPVFAPSDLIIDITKEPVATFLGVLEALTPGGRVLGLNAYFFNLMWDYSLPTTIPAFDVPSISGTIVEVASQSITWGIQSGAPTGYRVETTHPTTGQLLRKYTVDHPNNPQTLTRAFMTAGDWINPVQIKVTPFDKFGDGLPYTLAWGGASGIPVIGSGINEIDVTAPLTEVVPTVGVVQLAITDVVGDTGSGGARGTAPAPPAGSAAAGAFLRADGTWAVPVPTLPTLPYDIGLTLMGVLPSSGVIIHLPFAGLVGGSTTTVNFPSSFVGSKCHLLTAPTSTVVLSMYKISPSTSTITFIGTMTFTAGSVFGTFTVASPVTFTGGGATPDILLVLTPSAVDVSASDLGLILRGFRNDTGA